MVAQALGLTKRTKQDRPSSLTAAGLLAWASGNERRAERLFAEAIRMAEEHGAELLVANACFEQGRVLGLRGLLARARPLLARALEVYERIGAAPAAARTRRWLDKVGVNSGA